MSFLKLAVACAVLLLLPLVHAQVPLPNPPPSDQFGVVTLQAGAPKGLVKEDSQMVIPYKGSASVPVNVTVGCSLLVYETARDAADAGHIHVLVENPPSWLIAGELEIEPVSPADCDSGETAHTYAGAFPFSLAAGAPGVTTQVLNLTADFAGVGPAAPTPVAINVQFHPDYEVVPSIQFPYTVAGKVANFTVTVTNRGNARSMVMVEELHASTGTFSGLGSVVYQPPETQTFQVSFKAPDACWQSAKVGFKTFSHYLLLNQQAGSYKDERTFTWDFTNGIACTPGKGNTVSKGSPGGLLVLPAILGAAFLARRRLS